MDKPGCAPEYPPAVDPTYFETYKHYQAKQRAVSDPTTLILVDEADRLHMNSLEQMRSIFDQGIAGMVLIGMETMQSCGAYAAAAPSLGVGVGRKPRQASPQLCMLSQAISKEKGDLEILVQILIDQGDDSAHEGEKARIDELTQIANRRRFDEYLLQEWGRHLRMQRPLSLLICDVDHLKLYNDRYGHQAGDECLKCVAKALSECYRTGDLVARYGGEEFAMVLPQTNGAGAVQVAERVRAAVAAAALSHAASSICDRVTISIGVACMTPHPHGPADARTLVEQADRHLYLAKHLGRNQVRCEDEEITAL